MFKLTIAMVIAGYFSMIGFPVDFKNDDSRDYELSIHSKSGSTTRYTSYHKSVIKGICSDTCDIDVAGVGSIRANSGETVTVKEGRLSKQ
jgi:hypothetical protein